MKTNPLRFGSMPYDQFRGLLEGRVPINGAPVQYTISTLATDIFERMIRGREFDVAELGLTYYLRTLDSAERPFIALPIFPARVFRQSAIFVSTASGIEHTADRDNALLGEDPFAYGVAANRTAIDTCLRHHHEQQLSRLFTVEDIFASEVMSR